MRNEVALRGRWVLVTGASSGLGAEIARLLARAHGAHLVLSARRVERLTALKEELERTAGVQAVVAPADLERPDEVDALFGAAVDGRDLAGAVLNAGVTHFGRSLDLPWARLEALVATNVLSPVRLARLLAARWVERREPGALLLVTSLAGLMPVPFQTDYAAAKAFLTSWGLGLSSELSGSGVSVTTFAPGGIATEMLTSSGLDRVAKPGDAGVMDAARCARYAVAAFRARETFAVPGSLNRLSLALTRLLPLPLAARLVAKIYERGLAAPLPAEPRGDYSK